MKKYSTPVIVGVAQLTQLKDAPHPLDPMGLMTETCISAFKDAGPPGLKDLVDSFLEQGGTLLICTPCIQERGITKEMLLDMATPVKAARAVMEILEANNVLNY